MAAAVSAHVPVISVGNITAGGTGKTPCILMLADLFFSIGKKPAIISRGYKSGLEKKAAVYRMGDPSSYPSRWQGTSPT